MTNEVLSNYLLGKITWANKETTPIVRVHFFDKVNDKVDIIHSVLFKRKDEDTIYPYFDKIKCSVYIDDIIQFTREKNLNQLLHQ